jgi:hypothetical protein
MFEISFGDKPEDNPFILKNHRCAPLFIALQIRLKKPVHVGSFRAVISHILILLSVSQA